MIGELSGCPRSRMSTRGVDLNGRIPALTRAGLRGVNFHLDTCIPSATEARAEEDFRKVRQAIDDCLAAGVTVS